jgi:hypothetical protein
MEARLTKHVFIQNEGLDEDLGNLLSIPNDL